MVFLLQEDGARIYSGPQVELSGLALKLLKEWNQSKLFNSMMCDAKFIEVLMKSIFSRDVIKMGTYDTLSKVKISFIKGKK